MMNFLDIDNFLKENVDYLERSANNTGEEIAYYLTTKSYCYNPAYDENEEPYENKARLILLNKYGIKCLALRELNGCLYADFEVPVSNLTELKGYLNSIKEKMYTFDAHFKAATMNRNLRDAKKDFE